jgi:dihydrofolate reductase
MRTVRLYMTMTCDGCFAGPSGELDWMAAAADPDMNRDVVDLIGHADTAFMGYPTASGMIPYWHQAAANPAASEGEHAIADAVNRVHSLVLSRTEEEIPWDNAELLIVRDDDQLREAVHAAKNQPGRDIGVPGGIRTAQSFARLGLIDEYVFMMHPVALGEGKRIFNRRTNLDLHSAKTYSSGVTRLIYRPR